MIFTSIKSTLTTFNCIALVVVCAAVLLLSLFVHEELYEQAAKSDLDGLSENMAVDLVPLMAASNTDVFALTTTLLRLDSYVNVKFATIYDNQWESLQIYGGKSIASLSEITFDYKKPQNLDLPFGVYSLEGELVAYKPIGETKSPLGYLVIVNDSTGPLMKSKVSLISKALPLVLFVVTVSILFSVWLNSRMLSPLNTLAKLAHKIKQTKDYSINLNVDGKKEVSDLSDEISDMMLTINTETKKNKQYTNQLKKQRQDMERLANFDSLTGLPNRQFFLENLRLSLANAKRKGSNLALMYFDLDGFKQINDAYGHDIGDSLLIQVAERVKGYLREGDLFARLGGDEFLILLHNEPSELVLHTIAERLIDSLHTPFKINGWEVQTSASIGIVKADDSHFGVDEFVSNADIAMYRSKESGKNKHTIFVPEMMEENKRRLKIANSITSALSNDEFHMVYQPKVSPQQKIMGFEALIRWQSEELGFVSPVEFITVAEQTGKIGQITDFVIEKVCADMSQIQSQFGENVIVAINLSAHDIKNTAMFRYITDTFKRFKINPCSIEFEVTESAYLENFDMANDFLEKISKLGSSIALDDFGTGYSSLSYLTQIRLNTLKIDKQFVDKLGLSTRSSLITKTIIEMAKQLNLKICAEGVESQEQSDFLLSNGCHQLQGYLYGKPTKLNELHQLTKLAQ